MLLFVVGFLLFLSHEGVAGFVGRSKIWLAVPRASYSESSSTYRYAMSSSYDIDSDEEAEQRIGEHPIGHVSESVATSNTNGYASGGRYDDLLAQVGLEGKLKHVSTLPPKRKASCYDIFCNRELKQDKLVAVGFDM